ncbi:MAG TPA: hypothetical protein PKD53_26160 [Chloroflexaceae bacterium]|nr:hypothetical protein [Chloroflexaceae bacterium]
MRTTLREKLVLWLNGLALAACIELLLRSQSGPASAGGLAVIAATAVALGLLTALVLRWPAPTRRGPHMGD